MQTENHELITTAASYAEPPAITSEAHRPPADDEPSTDGLRGVRAIAGFIGETERRTSYLLENRVLPAGKEGAAWIASKKRLRVYHREATGGSQAA
jgi:hypothetical protein